MRIIKTLFSTALLSVSAVVAEAQVEIDVDNLRYTVLSDSALTVSVSSVPNASLGTEVNIPATVVLEDVLTADGQTGATFSVVTVADSGFAGATLLQKVTFASENFKIGASAFSGCVSLKSVSDSTDAAYIGSVGERAFFNCVKVDVDLSKTTIIRDYAFNGCSYSFSNGIVFAEELDSIGAHAFDDCSSLASVSFPETLIAIGDAAFNSDTLLTELSFPNSLRTISEGAFCGCSGLKTLTFPERITLGERAFADCSGLVSVDLGKFKSGSLGSGCFGSCFSLTSVTLSDSVTSISKGMFYSCKSLSTFTFPSGVTDILDEAFYGCSSLGKLTFPESLEYIGESAFGGCASLTFDSFPSSLKEIGSSAFYDCTSLENLSFPIGLETIDEGAFAGCTGLSSIAIPKNLASIGDGCFKDCSNLTSAVIEDGTVMTELGAIFYGAGMNDNFEVIVGSGVESIGENAFAESKITTITLPKTIKSLGAGAFSSSMLNRVNCYAVNPPSVVSSSADSEETATFARVNELYLYVPNISIEAYNRAWGSVVDLAKIEGVYGYAVDATADTMYVSTTQDLVDVFTTLSDYAAEAEEKNIDMKSEVNFDEVDLDLETLSAANVYTIMDNLPTVETYNGEWNASAVNNITARSAALFNTIGDSAKINNLAFNNATFYADLTDTATYTHEGDNVYIPILAKTINGKIDAFSFTGDIIVDADLAKDKNISVCLADEAGDSAVINGIVYLDNIEATGSNKRCITIKQNLGVRNSKTAKIKMAMQKLRQTGGNKSLDGEEFTYSEEELNKQMREFSDEEFASGVVAYWLNFDEAGYSGQYTPRWSQGKTIPVAATVKNGVTNALYPVDYGKTDMTHIAGGKLYANNGSLITISYDQKPSSITVGDEKIKNFSARSVTLTFDHTKPINILFGGEDDEDNSALREIESNGVTVATSGLAVTVNGADGQEKTLYNLTGLAVATTTGSELWAPTAGVYVVRIGATSAKIVVK